MPEDSRSSRPGANQGAAAPARTQEKYVFGAAKWGGVREECLSGAGLVRLMRGARGGGSVPVPNGLLKQHERLPQNGHSHESCERQQPEHEGLGVEPLAE